MTHPWPKQCQIKCRDGQCDGCLYREAQEIGWREAIEACLDVCKAEARYWANCDAVAVAACENIEGRVEKLHGAQYERRLAELESALRGALTALGQISDRDSIVRTQVRNAAIAAGWKALGQ